MASQQAPLADQEGDAGEGPVKRPRQHVAKGQACRRCSSRKIKCDGDRPCRRCSVWGLVCEDAGSASSDPNAHHILNRPLHLPISRSQVPTSVHATTNQLSGSWSGSVQPFSLSEVVQPSSSTVTRLAPSAVPTFVLDRLITDSTAAPSFDVCQKLHAGKNWMRKFVDLGWDHREVSDLIRNLPPRLSAAVGRLSDQTDLMAAAQPDSVCDGWEEVEPPIWAESQHCASLFYALNPDFTTRKVRMNSLFVQRFGSSVESLREQVSKGTMPMPTSQLRHLCVHLHCMWVFLTSHTAPTNLFVCARLDPQHLITMRVSMKLFCTDGLVTHSRFSNIAIKTAEFDAAVAADPNANGIFLECNRTSADFLREPDIVEAERISTLMATPKGRARLDRLADKINAMLDSL